MRKRIFVLLLSALLLIPGGVFSSATPALAALVPPTKPPTPTGGVICPFGGYWTIVNGECKYVTPTPTSTATVSPTTTPTISPTATPTPTIGGTPTIRPTGTVLPTATATATPPNPQYCLKHYFIYPWGEGLDYFYIEDVVTFELYNACNTPITLPTTNPFVIKLAGQMPDDSGEWWPTLYTPPVVEKPITIEPGAARVWTWDTTANSGSYKLKPRKVYEGFNGRLHDFVVSYNPDVRAQVDPRPNPDCWADSAGQQMCSHSVLDYDKQPAHFFALNVNPRKNDATQISLNEAVATAGTTDSGSAPVASLINGPLRIGSETLRIALTGIKLKNQTAKALNGDYYLDVRLGVPGREISIDYRTFTLNVAGGATIDLPRIEYQDDTFPIWMDRMMSNAEEGYNQLSLMVSLQKKDSTLLTSARLPIVSFPTFQPQNMPEGATYEYQMEGSNGFGAAYSMSATASLPVIGHGLNTGTYAGAFMTVGYGDQSAYVRTEMQKNTTDQELPVKAALPEKDMRVLVGQVWEAHCSPSRTNKPDLRTQCLEKSVPDSGELTITDGTTERKANIKNGTAVFPNASFGKYSIISGKGTINRLVNEEAVVVATDRLSNAYGAVAKKDDLSLTHSATKLYQNAYLSFQEDCGLYDVTGTKPIKTEICIVDEASKIAKLKELMVPDIIAQYNKYIQLPLGVRPDIQHLDTRINFSLKNDKNPTRVGDANTGAYLGLYLEDTDYGLQHSILAFESRLMGWMYENQKTDYLVDPHAPQTTIVHELMHYIDGKGLGFSKDAYLKALKKQIVPISFVSEKKGPGQAQAVQTNGDKVEKTTDTGRRLWNILSLGRAYWPEAGGYNATLLNGELYDDFKSGQVTFPLEAFAEEISTICVAGKEEYGKRLNDIKDYWKIVYQQDPPPDLDAMIQAHKDRLKADSSVQKIIDFCLQ